MNIFAKLLKPPSPAVLPPTSCQRWVQRIAAASSAWGQGRVAFSLQRFLPPDHRILSPLRFGASVGWATGGLQCSSVFPLVCHSRNKLPPICREHGRFPPAPWDNNKATLLVADLCRIFTNRPCVSYECHDARLPEINRNSSICGAVTVTHVLCMIPKRIRRASEIPK
jgi:hypothetical protein